MLMNDGSEYQKNANTHTRNLEISIRPGICKA